MHSYIVQHNPNLTQNEKRRLKDGTFTGWELVKSTARVFIMNLMLHRIGSETNVSLKAGIHESVKNRCP